MSPRGKQNSLREHRNNTTDGFYAGSFSPQELEDLDKITAGAADEIALLRVSIRRLFEIAAEKPLNLEDWIKYINTASGALYRLSELLRLQALLTGKEPNVAEWISKALQEINSGRTGSHLSP